MAEPKRVASEPEFRAGPPWPPSVIEATKRLLLWTLERHQQEQVQVTTTD